MIFTVCLHSQLCEEYRDCIPWRGVRHIPKRRWGLGCDIKLHLRVMLRFWSFGKWGVSLLADEECLFWQMRSISFWQMRSISFGRWGVSLLADEECLFWQMRSIYFGRWGVSLLANEEYLFIAISLWSTPI